MPPLDFEAFPTCKLQILFLRIADQQRAESSAMRVRGLRAIGTLKAAYEAPLIYMRVTAGDLKGSTDKAG